MQLSLLAHLEIIQCCFGDGCGIFLSLNIWNRESMEARKQEQPEHPLKWLSLVCCCALFLQFVYLKTFSYHSASKGVTFSTFATWRCQLTFSCGLGGWSCILWCLCQVPYRTPLLAARSAAVALFPSPSPRRGFYLPRNSGIIYTEFSGNGALYYRLEFQKKNHGPENFPRS